MSVKRIRVHVVCHSLSGHILQYIRMKLSVLPMRDDKQSADDLFQMILLKVHHGRTDV